LKIGISQAGLDCAGNISSPSCNNEGDLDGRTYAVGTKTKFASGIYIQTEAGATGFESVRITNIGGSSAATLHARPTVAYGAVAIGFQF